MTKFAFVFFVWSHVAVSSLGCERRNYAGMCPEGWLAAGVCQAPLSYAGPCPGTASLGDFSEGMKRQFEQNCRVQWPCEAACVSDYSLPCPQGWVDMGNGVCDAPALYDNHCLKHVRMHSEEFKRSFAAECGVHWPCLNSCSQDFGQPCPEGWGAFEGVCEAPATYVGPCAPFANLQDLTIQDKAQYAALCQTNFPCRTQSQGMPDCEPTDDPCPKGWEQKGSSVGVCVGAQYKGPCRPQIDVAAIGLIGKHKFMESCGLQWDCKANLAATVDSAAPGPMMISRSGPVDFDGFVVDPSI